MAQPLANEPRGVWRLANDAARLYADTVAVSLPLALPVGLLSLLPALLARDPGHAEAPLSLLLGNVLANLLMIAGLLLLVPALQHRLWACLRGEGSAPASVMAAARRLRVLLLTGLAMVLGGVVILLAAIGAGLLAATLIGKDAGATLAGLLTLLAMTFYLVRLYPLMTVAVLEPHGVAATLNETWALTRGRFWPMLGTLLLVGLLALAGLLIVSLAAGLLVALVPALSEPLAAGLSLVVVGTFTTPLAAATALVLWNDLRLRRPAQPPASSDAS